MCHFAKVQEEDQFKNINEQLRETDMNWKCLANFLVPEKYSTGKEKNWEKKMVLPIFPTTVLIGENNPPLL